MRKLWTVGSLVLAVAGIAAWLAFRAPPAPPVRLEPVAVAVTGALTMELLWLARERGFFQSAGVDVSVQKHPFGKNALEALTGGKAQLAAVSEFVLAKGAYSHPDLRAVSVLATNNDIKLLGLKERGIGNIADLKGKRVAVSLGSMGEFFLSRVLASSGLSHRDIDAVDTLPADMGTALADGKADAAITWQPYVHELTNRFGAHAAVFDAQPGHHYHHVLIGREEWLGHNGDTIERVLAALKRSEDWVQAHPEEFRDFLRARTGSEVVPDDLRYVVSLPASLLAALGEELSWLAGKQAGDAGVRPPDALDLIDPRPLRAAVPAAVTVVR